MFFSTYVLTKKGPLAKIWLAAHWDKKLTQKDVKVVDLNETVVQIVAPAVPIALRTSGELMLGVVRIYALKVAQLLKDATEVTITLKPRNIQVVKAAAGKEGAAGITMDLVVGRVGAEQLCEADFNDIADILAPNKAKKGPLAEAEVIGTAWFPVESSQLDADITALADADIAKVRQDLLAHFGAARDGSSTTTKKSSLSSVEHARAAAAGLAGAAVDALDIGVPVPDDLDIAVPPPLADFGEAPLVPGFDDVFAPPALMGEAATPGKVARKVKAVQLIDANDTVMAKQTLQRQLDDRHDIVCAERRHGALDDAEARDRHLLRHENPLAACDTALPVPNAALRAVFQKALRSSNATAVEALERGRGLGMTGEKADDKLAAPAPEDLPEAVEPPLPEFAYAADVPEAPELLEPARPSKRGRGAAEDKEKLAGHTLETLARVKSLLGARTGASAKFSALIKNEPRVAATRMFVDVLALASHNYVAVAQAAPYAELTLSAGPKLLSATA